MSYDMNMIHHEASPLAGRIVILKPEVFGGKPCKIRDWFDRVAGKSWTEMGHYPAVKEYRDRMSVASLSVIDDEVLLGQVEMTPVLIRADEVQRVMPTNWVPPGTAIPVPPVPPDVDMGGVKADMHSDADFKPPEQLFVSPAALAPALLEELKAAALLEELKAAKEHLDKFYKLLGL